MKYPADWANSLASSVDCVVAAAVVNVAAAPAPVPAFVAVAQTRTLPALIPQRPPGTQVYPPRRCRHRQPPKAKFVVVSVVAVWAAAVVVGQCQMVVTSWSMVADWVLSSGPLLVLVLVQSA